MENLRVLDELKQKSFNIYWNTKFDSRITYIFIIFEIQFKDLSIYQKNQELVLQPTIVHIRPTSTSDDHTFHQLPIYAYLCWYILVHVSRAWSAIGV